MPVIQDLLDRMNRDMGALEREWQARQKVEPLTRPIQEGYYRFPGGSPTRLHVSSRIYGELMKVLEARMDSLLTPIEQLSPVFMGCPVHEIDDLEGFRWVREGKYGWGCGPEVKVE